MTKIIMAGTILILAGAAQAAPLEILSVRPSGELKDRRESVEITVTFNQPMTPLAASEETSGFCPLKISPKVPGSCAWQGNNVLTYIPTEPLALATSYRVSVPEGTASKVTGETLSRIRTWSFTTMRPGLVRSRPEHKALWVQAGEEVFLQFNMDMDPVQARNWLRLYRSRPGPIQERGRYVPTGVRRATRDEIKKIWPWAYGIKPSTHNVLVLHPSVPMERGLRYRVVLRAGLPAKEGALGLKDEKTLELETYFPFEFLAPTSRVSFCLPHSMNLTFNNPILFPDLLSHISFEPPVRISTGTLKYRKTWTGYKLKHNRHVNFDLNAPFEPDREYVLYISSALKDAGGQALGRTVEVPIRTQGYCPYFNMLSGTGVLESYLPPLHPVETLNTGPLLTRSALIPKEHVIPFHKTMRGTPTNKTVSVPAAVRERSWDPEVKRNYRVWQGFDLGPALGRRKSGVVFLEMMYRNRWNRAFVNLTRLGLTVKSSKDSTLIWTNYLRTAKPAIGVKLEIRDDKNKILWKGKSSRKGLALAPGWMDLGITKWTRYSTPKLWVFAEERQGLTVTASDWRGGIRPWRLGVSYNSHAEPREYKGTMFTERGVYRSGETVHMKGIVRRLLRGDWTRSDADEVILTVTDPRGTEVHKTTITVSKMSSFDHDYAIPEGSPTGNWSVKAVLYAPGDVAPAKAPSLIEGFFKYGNIPVDLRGKPVRKGRPVLEFYAGFRVEPFKPASFEVKVHPLQDSYLASGELEASIDGWYLFGAPMADAPVEWKLRMESGRHSPPGHEGYAFGPPWWDGSHTRSWLIASAKGTLDEKGKIRASAVLDTRKSARVMRAVLEASATSPERQRLSGRGSVLVHPASLYVGLKPVKHFITKGEKVEADMIVTTPEGDPVDGQEIVLTLTRRYWHSVRKAGIGGRLEWISEKRDVIVATKTFVSGTKPMRFSFTPGDTGRFLLKAVIRDKEGRANLAGVDYYVTGEGEMWWHRQDTDIIELVPEKKKYKPGQTARIMVKSPYRKARALITVEREGIIDSWVTQLKGGADFIKVPLRDKHVPNVYVGVMLVQGRTGKKKFDEKTGDDLGKPSMKIGYASLRVDPGGRRLDLEVKTDKKEYRPGGKVQADILVKDGRSRGLPSEVTLFVVDEGVLSLTSYATPDVFSAFYGNRSLQVGTADNRLYVIGQRNFGEKGKPRGGGGGGVSLAGIDLRTKFVPTAFWAPSVMTDGKGRARVEFELPDNLSRFRVMAVAHTGKRFGSGESKFTVKKPLLLRPSLPRFSRIEDTFKGGVVIHNYTAAAATVTFNAGVEGDAVLCPGSSAQVQRLVPGGKAVEVLWDCQAKAVGTGVFQFRARAGNESDGLQWKVPVTLPTKLETVATLGVVGTPAKELIKPPKGAIPGLGGLEVGVSATALSGLQEGVRFLFQYPYGCLEQKMSRIFPVLVSADLTSAFGLGDLTELKQVVREIFSKLRQFQSSSGGFCYWGDGCPRPDPYLTTYVFHASAIAQKEGYYIDKRVLDRAKAFLERYVKGHQVDTAYPYSLQEDLVAKAYAVYALALHGSRQESAFNQLYGARERLPLTGKAHLLRAARLLQKTYAVERLGQELLNRVSTSPTTLYFEMAESERMPWIHSSAVRTTALSLQSMLEAKGGFPGDEKAVRWLVEERRIKGRWRTTQENSLALQAFQDFYRTYERDIPDFTSRVTVGTEIWNKTFKGRSLATHTRSFGMDKLHGKTTPLTVDKIGTGRLYYTLRMSYLPEEGAPAKDQGFSLTRKIEKLYGPGEGQELGAGARAVVTLTVKTLKDRTFVALENPIPGGFEIVDPSFGTESKEDARLLQERSKRGHSWGTFQRSEKYDDRIVIFADYLKAGEHHYSFLVQATVAGTFMAPPAFVEQMYQPEVFGRSASGEVTIR